MKRKYESTPLAETVKSQIVQWLADHDPGSLIWTSKSILQYWPKVGQSDVKEFLQLDPRIRSHVAHSRETR